MSILQFVGKYAILYCSTELMMLFQNTSYCGTSYCDDLAWEDTSRWFREIEILLPNDSMRWKSLIRWFSGVEIFLSDDSVREHHPVASVGRKTHPLEPRHARHQFLLQHCHLCLSGCFIFNYNVYIHCDISFSVSFIYMFDDLIEQVFLKLFFNSQK